MWPVSLLSLLWLSVEVSIGYPSMSITQMWLSPD